MQTKTVQRITRLKLGTNTLHALRVNEHPVVTVMPGGLFIDPRAKARFIDTLIGDTAYILGSMTLNGVEIVIDADSIAIGGRWHADRVALERTAYPDRRRGAGAGRYHLSVGDD